MYIEPGLLGNSIRQARLAAGISQEKLSEMLDISPMHLKHLESEHRHPSIEVLFKIAITLNMSIDNLLFPSDDERKDSIHRVEILLNQCTDSELEIVEDLICSLQSHRD